MILPFKLAQTMILCKVKEIKREEKITQYFYTGSSLKTYYIEFSIDRLSFTKQTNSAKYKQVFFGYEPFLANPLSIVWARSHSRLTP